MNFRAPGVSLMSTSVPALGEWQWDPAGAISQNGGMAVPFEAGDRLELRIAEDGRSATLGRLKGSGTWAWRRELPLDGASAGVMVAQASTVYAAFVPAHAAGARLVAVDADTGAPRWSTGLLGIGPTGHSKYSNRVQLRVVGDLVIVFGEESAGRYVEARAVTDGRLAFNSRTAR
jgi:outer membrane protein assembly factor BamB